MHHEGGRVLASLVDKQSRVEGVNVEAQLDGVQCVNAAIHCAVH